MLHDVKTKTVGCFLVEHDAESCQPQLATGSDKRWTWKALDRSDREPKFEQLCLKFASKELAVQVKIALNEAVLCSRT